jgi:hypothetical protein
MVLALLVLALSVEIALHAIYAVKFVMLIRALLLVILRALWVRLQPPEGERLARRDEPELFALLDRLRARLCTPPVHEVLVTADFNAGITQVPGPGVRLAHRNYLTLGLSAHALRFGSAARGRAGSRARAGLAPRAVSPCSSPTGD